jgi:hypothetical protein
MSDATMLLQGRHDATYLIRFKCQLDKVRSTFQSSTQLLTAPSYVID